MKLKIFGALMLFTSLCFSQEEPAQSPKIVVKVALEEQVILEKHTIKFLKVIEDSRCPKDANCIWAGRAKILVEITSDEDESFQKEIVLGKAKPNENSDLLLFKNEDKRIIVYQLNPYPISGVQTNTKDYILLICVEN